MHTYTGTHRCSQTTCPHTQTSKGGNTHIHAHVIYEDTRAIIYNKLTSLVWRFVGMHVWRLKLDIPMY